MGKARETTVVSQQTTPQATPQEQELQRLEMERVRAVQPGLISTQQQGLELISQLLAGETELPGFFGELGKGISPEVAQSLAGQAVETSRPGFQSLGLSDSGVAFEQQTKTAADILRGAEEFNIGNRFNLLNLAFGGQAQVQQPIMGQQAMLSQRLAGLRPTTTFGQNVLTRPQQQSYLWGLYSTG